MCIGIGGNLLLALVMGYNPGEAAGLLAGSQTISAVIGVAEDTMANMGLDEAQRQSYINIIPVSYAVTYVSVRQAQPGYSPPRSKTIGRTGESKSCLQRTGSQNG